MPLLKEEKEFETRRINKQKCHFESFLGEVRWGLAEQRVGAIMIPT